MLILPFSNSLLIICGINQMPVSKSMFASLITVLSSTCFHYHCAASLILTSTLPGVTRVTIGIGQRRVRPLNDLFLLVFERPLITGGPSTWSFRSRLSLIETSLQALFLPSVTPVVWLHQIVRRYAFTFHWLFGFIGDKLRIHKSQKLLL